MENLLEFPFVEVSAVGGSQMFHGNVDQFCTDHVSHADETLHSGVSQVPALSMSHSGSFGVLWRSFKPRTQSLSAVCKHHRTVQAEEQAVSLLCTTVSAMAAHVHWRSLGCCCLHALLGSIPLGCWLWTSETNSFHCSWILKSFTCSFFTPENLEVKHADCFSLSDLFNVSVEVRSPAFCQRW